MYTLRSIVSLSAYHCSFIVHVHVQDSCYDPYACLLDYCFGLLSCFDFWFHSLWIYLPALDYVLPAILNCLQIVFY